MVSRGVSRGDVADHQLVAKRLYLIHVLPSVRRSVGASPAAKFPLAVAVRFSFRPCDVSIAGSSVRIRRFSCYQVSSEETVADSSGMTSRSVRSRFGTGRSDPRISTIPRTATDPIGDSSAANNSHPLCSRRQARMLDYFSPFATTETESLISVAFRGFAQICHKGTGCGRASLPDNCAPGRSCRPPRY